jgi:hypothetical protein
MKELVVVFGIGFAAFWLARPVAILYTAAEDFDRRRKVWLILTAVAFVSPNLWVFALAAVPLYAWTARKDSNPVAAYLLLMHVVPPVAADLPALGSMVLFEVDNYRLLSFCILLPIAYRAWRRPPQVDGTSRRSDWLFFAFGILQIALYVPPDLPGHVILHDSATNVLRRAFLMVVDVFALYYAISRSCSDRRKIVDAMAAFCMGALIMALIATFEHVRGWLLYSALAQRWNPSDMNFTFAWLVRGDSWLRTQASAGHALSLAFMLAVAFGFWLYLLRSVTSWRPRVFAIMSFWSGLIASFSRGPATGAVLILLSYSAFRPRAVTRLFRAAVALAVTLAILAMTPLGDNIMSAMPGFGHAPDETLLYRQRLLDRSFELIQEHPLLGDPIAMSQMEDLRQGQGIIDIVNTYVGVALFYGLLGFALFSGFIIAASTAALRAARSVIRTDLEHGLLGLDLLACIVGMLFMMADCSLVYGVEKSFYAVISLTVAYARLTGTARRAVGAPLRA